MSASYVPMSHTCFEGWRFPCAGCHGDMIEAAHAEAMQDRFVEHAAQWDAAQLEVTDLRRPVNEY